MFRNPLLLAQGLRLLTSFVFLTHELFYSSYDQRSQMVLDLRVAQGKRSRNESRTKYFTGGVTWPSTSSVLPILLKGRKG